MKMNQAIACCLAASLIFSLPHALPAAPIPLSLPDPDGKPGDPAKPVKVYVLAGQSNMVGMGDISGAKPQYPAVYLSADPAIIPGLMPAGSARTRGACRWHWRNVPALAAHGIYQSADADAPAGAIVNLHPRAYQSAEDLLKSSPAKLTSVALGTVDATIPWLDGPCTAVASAFIDVPASGNYLVRVGFESSTHAVASIDGKEVYRKEVDGQPVLTKITLEAGKRYPLSITYFKGGSAALWLEQVDLVGTGDLVTLTKKDRKFPYLIDEAGESPCVQDFHYHRNPEFYLLTGEAMGRAMVRLLGAQAEEIPKSDREAKTMAAIAAEAAKPVPTAAQIEASNTACKPMIFDGLRPKFLADPKTAPLLKAQLVTAQPMPDKHPEYLDDAVDDAVAFLQTVGIRDYDWKPVIPEMKSTTWEYTGFNMADSPYQIKPTDTGSEQDAEGAGEEPAPKGKKGKNATAPRLTIDYPAGLENWFSPDFDPKKAGCKSGPAPFGVKRNAAWPENLTWLAKYPLYPLNRPQPATLIDHDVVLMRQTFEPPPIQEGHRYRIRLEGSIHENSGEGYAIYVNGKLMGEMTTGVINWRRQGLRGSHVWQDFLDDFKGGKITIAVANFPMANYNPQHFIPGMAPLSVWIESQKLPELGL